MDSVTSKGNGDAPTGLPGNLVVQGDLERLDLQISC